MIFTHAEGATPIDLGTANGLIPSLTTQKELNEFEQTNITMGYEWARRSRKLKQTLLTIDGVQLLHKRMFDQTRRWAGKFRQIDLNTGVEWRQIPQQLKTLCDDVKYWDENASFEQEEIAVRFHHRLVQIHPFPNGNGRLSRMAADLYLMHKGKRALTWGKTTLVNESSDRKEYISSLRVADNGDYARLLRFYR